MYRVSLALILAILLPTQAVAQSRSTDPIVALEERWADALVEKDRATIANLTDPRFRIVELSDDKPISREQYLAISGITVRSVEFELISLTYHGSTAIVVMDYFMDWSIDGVAAKMPTDFRVIDMLHHKNGEWVVIHRLSEVQQNN